MLIFFLFSLFSFGVISPSAFSFELPTSLLIPQHRQEEPRHEPLRTRILEQYQKWKGTTYEFGGTTYKGVDCSSLTQHLLQGAANFSLPRTTGEQMHRGTQIPEFSLKPGDLIFFRTGVNSRHVGVYIGDNQFIHASKSEGVMVSMLGSYWQSRYITARRVLNQFA